MGAEGMIQSKPSDGGYGWVILASSSFCMFLIVSVGRIGGMVFSAIVEEYRVNRTQVTVIFVVSRVLAFGLAPVAGKLLEKYTYKSVFCISGLLMSLGLILTAFCTEIWQIVLTYGVLLGTGSGLLISAAVLIVGLYFKERKSFAFGIYYAAGGCGGFLMPILYGILLEEYGYYSSMYILGAIMLHVCAVGMLIRQPVLAPKTPHKQQEVPLMGEKSDAIEEQIVAAVDNDQILMRSLQSLKSGHREENGNDVRVSKNDNTWKTKLISFMRGLKQDLQLFKDPAFLCLVVSRVGIAFPVLTFMSYFPDYVKHEFSVEMSDTDIAYVLSISSIGDILSRLIVGSLFDKLPWKKKYTVSFLGLMLTGFFFTFQLMQSYISLFVYIIIYGLLVGIYVVCNMVVETELMGPKRLPVAHGLIQFFLGIMTLVGGIVVGYVRDVTGSYEINLYMFGGFALCGGAIWFFEPVLRKCLSSSSPATEETKDENNHFQVNGNKV